MLKDTPCRNIQDSMLAHGRCKSAQATCMYKASRLTSPQTHAALHGCGRAQCQVVPTMWTCNERCGVGDVDELTPPDALKRCDNADGFDRGLQR